MEYIGLVFIILSGIAVTLAIFFGMGGVALFNRKEKPEKIIGKEVGIHDFDEFGRGIPEKIYGKIVSYDGQNYKVDLEEAVVFENLPKTTIFIT